MRTELSDMAFRIAQAIDPQAFIAGGFVRDSLLGRKTADVDIYLHVSQQSKAYQDARRAVCYLARVVCPEAERVGTCYTREGYDSYIKLLHGATKFKTPLGNIDLLFTKEPVDPLKVFKSFDIGLCMAGCYDDYKPIKAEAFHYDVCEHVITAYPEHLSNGYQTALHALHMGRIARKYWDFSMDTAYNCGEGPYYDNGVRMKIYGT